MDELIQVRMSSQDKEVLDRLADYFGGNVSATIRHLIKDKARDLGFWEPEHALTQSPQKAVEVAP